MNKYLGDNMFDWNFPSQKKWTCVMLLANITQRGTEGVSLPEVTHLTFSLPSGGSGWETSMTSEPPILMYSLSVDSLGREKSISCSASLAFPCSIYWTHGAGPSFSAACQGKPSNYTQTILYQLFEWQSFVVLDGQPVLLWWCTLMLFSFVTTIIIIIITNYSSYGLNALNANYMHIPQ